MALGWDALEERTYLSTGLTGHPGGAVAELARVHPHATRGHNLTGTIRGSFQVVVTATGPVLNATGSGNIRGVGPVSTSGGIPLGATASGTFQATFVASASQGNANLFVSGATPSNLKKPIKVSVTLVGTTGSFVGVQGSGSGTIKLNHLTSDDSAGNFTFTLRVTTS
jgi:hypothetical protein